MTPNIKIKCLRTPQACVKAARLFHRMGARRKAKDAMTRARELREESRKGAIIVLSTPHYRDGAEGRFWRLDLRPPRLATAWEIANISRRIAG